MRRLLIALALAVAVGGTVLGAAATLNLAPRTLSAGTATVGSCDPSGAAHTVHFLGGTTWNGTFFRINTVEVQNLPDSCSGLSWSVVVTHDGVSLGQVDGTASDWYTSGPNNWYIGADFSGRNVDAAAVNGVSVVINDQ